MAGSRPKSQVKEANVRDNSRLTNGLRFLRRIEKARKSIRAGRSVGPENVK
jgi:hypothetical protein